MTAPRGLELERVERSLPCALQQDLSGKKESIGYVQNVVKFCRCELRSPAHAC